MDLSLDILYGLIMEKVMDWMVSFIIRMPDVYNMVAPHGQIRVEHDSSPLCEVESAFSPCHHVRLMNIKSIGMFLRRYGLNG
ncbi:hypothetical protein H5410_004119 [Solanum commersonii]|uniref:Uncharacterized protein n=1 Tax=Solanum commersonii TaxID=4109 RepID=A0A9J6B719_SOLCO|nr:hypothetical protein H5410_004119 [Solanum commersonii]